MVCEGNSVLLSQELRLEDYQANRKGPSNPVGAGAAAGLFGSSTATSSTATGLFGSSTTNTGFSYGQNKTAFGTSKYCLAPAVVVTR